jgi:hypothetical protein
MRILIMCAAVGAGLVASTSTSLAAITCWYNASSDYTGSDDADPRFPLGKVTAGSGGDYAWGYTIDAPNGQSCPRKLPPH